LATQDEVEQFLRNFKVKLNVFGVTYVGREKNAQTLLDMEWVSSKRTDVLKELEVTDYCEGPLDETMHGAGNMWVFGKEISGTEFYIKIAMGRTNNNTICISFHTSEQPLNYPFKV
jgi:hypothetical protein